MRRQSSTSAMLRESAASAWGKANESRIGDQQKDDGWKSCFANWAAWGPMLCLPRLSKRQLLQELILALITRLAPAPLSTTRARGVYSPAFCVQRTWSSLLKEQHNRGRPAYGALRLSSFPNPRATTDPASSHKPNDRPTRTRPRRHNAQWCSRRTEGPCRRCQERVQGTARAATWATCAKAATSP